MSFSDSRWKTDCRHFEGERPCVYKRECEGCDRHEPVIRRVLVLKIGALGDVLRTTPLLAPLTSGADGATHVTWVVGESARPLLEGHPRIDRLLTPGYETSEWLGALSFDVVLSLDKDLYTTALTSRLTADEMRGFGRDPTGALIPLHRDSQYAYDLGLSDRMKFHENRKTYQEIVFEMCGLPWGRQEYDVPRVDEKRERGLEVLRDTGAPSGGGPLVGLNTGAGRVFANKAWTPDGYAELARRLADDGCRVVLLGGPDERERNRLVAAQSGGAAALTPTDLSLSEFGGLVAACDLVVTGDTLGMHLAIAARVPVVVLFGSTCSQEIELYGRGEKVVTSIDCHPCYLRECDIRPSCQDLITPDEVHTAVRRTLRTSRS